jgi:hypothetical protein
MIGTIVNTIAIIVGGILGLIIKGRFTKRFQEIVSQATGMAVLFIGASGAIKQLLDPDCNAVLFVVSLVIGGLIGEAIDIELRLKKLGDRLESLCGDNSGVSKSFVSASLLFCVGTMSILGAIQSGLQHDYATLYTKSILDGVTAIIFASTLGFGVLFSAVSVFLYQGAITLAAAFVEPYITADILRELSLVGGILITALGIDMLGIRKMRVGNLLPAVFVPVVYYIILGLFKG